MLCYAPQYDNHYPGAVIQFLWHISTFWVLTSHMSLTVTGFETADVEHYHHFPKFYWIVLLGETDEIIKCKIVKVKITKENRSMVL